VLASIQGFFNQFLNDVSDSADTEYRLQLATAALLIEVMRTDDIEHEQEQQVLLKRLQQKFSLNEQRCQQIITLAEEQVKIATDYHQFTRLINDHFSQLQKIHIIELMWAVAWADGNVDSWEEHLIRRISDLIYVSHGDFIAAKHAAMPSS